jgi:uncharacterized repeat protein (TIGR01451 family)
VKLYADTNGDGIYTPGVDLQITAPVTLASEETFDFFMVAVAPGGLSNGDNDTVEVQATGTVGATPASATNTDTITVAANAAAIVVNKTIDKPSGVADSGPYTYTIRYENTGDNDATAILLYDALPEHMDYVPNSAKLNGVAITDGQDDANITYVVDLIDPAAETVKALIRGGVAQGKTGRLTFQVMVGPGAIVNNNPITNTPKYCYQDSNGVSPLACDDATPDGLDIDDTVGANGSDGTPVDFNVTNFDLSKEQALDAGCDGCGGSCTYQKTNITTGAVPGACIKYRVVATNLTDEQVTAVVITDHTPSYTTYNAASGTATVSVGVIQTVPADGNTGDVIANVGTLAPNGTAVMTFGVKID